QATTSAGALVTGGNITISAGSLTVSGGVQGSSDRAAFNGSSGANRATTLANANIVATGNLAYTGGPVTLQGGTARTQGSSGSANSAIAEASAGIQVAGTKTLNITGDLQILGGSALDSVVAPNVGSAVARAVLDPGALDATASGNVVLSDGTVTGTGSAYSAVIASGVTLQADGMSIGGTINAGGGTVILRPNSTTRNINIESGATSGVLSLNPSELQKITAGTLEIGRTTDTGTLSVNTALNTADVNAATLILQHQNISVNGDIGSAVTPFQHDLALLAGNGVSTNNSIVLHSGGSLALVAATGDLDIMPSTVPTRVESLDMALLAGGNVNVGSASGTQSTTVLANRLLTVGAASNFTVRGGAEAGAFTSVGGGGLTVIATVGDVIVAGGGGSNASATVSGTPDVDMLVAGVVRLDAGTGTGASAAISAGSATSIRLELPNLESGGFFVNGQEGVVYDAATATGFLAGGAPAVLGQSLLVTYGGAPPPSSPPSTREPGVQQAINTIVQSTTEASRTGERTASQDAGPTEEEKQKEKEERARAVCN
ncbi:MAG: hypothetical protein HYY79_09610, partial [Betaproteobacteria bacterium]|nr:hypothetical protein [Betaproteobacteria bacterium]